MFSIIQAAGWPIWFLLLASIIAVALMIERSVALRRAKIVPTGLLQSVVAEYRQAEVNDAMFERASRRIRRWGGFSPPDCVTSKAPAK